MTKKVLLISIISAIILKSGFCQKIYPTSSLEFIFSFADVEVNNVNQNTGVRFSVFFNYGQQWHMDFTDKIGMYTGGYIKNIGFKIKENDRVDIHRVYSVGVPLALKLGSFKNHLFFYGGGQYEMFLHYKHKQKTDDDKTKTSQWFSDRVNLFTPSVFAGIQFPKGLNVKFCYYLDQFLNQDFSGSSFNEQVDYSQWNTQVFYISLSINMKTSSYKKIIKKESEYASLYF